MLQPVLQFLEQYGNVSGYHLDVKKCGVVFEGPYPLPLGTTLVGVRSKVKYLGRWLGHSSIIRPLATLMAEAQFLASMLLKAEETLAFVHPSVSSIVAYRSHFLAHTTNYNKSKFGHACSTGLAVDPVVELIVL